MISEKEKKTSLSKKKKYNTLKTKQLKTHYEKNANLFCETKKKM